MRRSHGFAVMTRHLPYDLLAAATVAAMGTAVIWSADASPRRDGPGSMLQVAENWPLRSPEPPEGAERRAVRIVYQPLIGTP